MHAPERSDKYPWGVKTKLPLLSCVLCNTARTLNFILQSPITYSLCDILMPAIPF